MEDFKEFIKVYNAFVASNDAHGLGKYMFDMNLELAEMLEGCRNENKLLHYIIEQREEEIKSLKNKTSPKNDNQKDISVDESNQEIVNILRVLVSESQYE